LEEVWAPDGLDSTGQKLGSEHAHKQSMLTSRVCSQAEYAHKQSMLTSRACSQAEYAHKQSMLTSRVCTQVEHAHKQSMCSQAEWSRHLLPRVVHSMARSSRYNPRKFDGTVGRLGTK